MLSDAVIAECARKIDAGRASAADTPRRDPVQARKTELVEIEQDLPRLVTLLTEGGYRRVKLVELLAGDIIDHRRIEPGSVAVMLWEYEHSPFSADMTALLEACLAINGLAVNLEPDPENGGRATFYLRLAQ